jgi:hypothetical protein
MAIKTLRVFQEFTSEGYVPMPPSGNIDYGVTIAGTFPEETPTTFQLDDPDIDVEVTEMTDFYVWIRSHGSEWNINYTRNVRVYPDSPLINNVVMGIIIANLDYTVPYVGATENVDLGEFGLSGGFLHLDNTPTLANVPTTPGTLVWNDADGTADLKLKGGNVTLQLGQEQVVRVVNKTGATLNESDFRAVRIRSVAEGGAQGQRLAVVLAQGDNDPDSATTIGLVTESILNNEEGFITTSGEVKKIDTTGAKSYGGTETWVDGDVLYLSPTHPGYLTKVKPQAPDHTIIIGWVVYAHANNGKIFVKVDNGYELDELHNVKITNPFLDDFLMYDTTLNVWKNKDMHGTKGYIPYYNDTTLFLNSPFWTDGGLIGVNTITPRSLMDLKGTTAYTKLIVDNNGATGGGMFSAYQNGAETAMFGADAHYQTNTSIDAAIVAKKAGGGIQFYTNGSQSEKMGINSDGNVFVGQTPTYVAGATQLVVRGKTGAGFLGVNHYDMSIKGFMNTFNSVFQVGTSTFHSLAFLVENTERGRVNSSGRLLWGTTTDNGTDLVQINGSLIASSIKRNGGTSSQYLMADGSVSTLGSFVPTSRTLTINGTSYDLSADRTWTIAGVISGLTTNYVPKATGATTIGNSQLFDNGTNVIIGGTTSSTFKLDVNGTARFANDVQINGFLTGTYTRVLAAGNNFYGQNITLSKTDATSNLVNRNSWTLNDSTVPYNGGTIYDNRVFAVSTSNSTNFITLNQSFILNNGTGTQMGVGYNSISGGSGNFSEFIHFVAGGPYGYGANTNSYTTYTGLLINTPANTTNGYGIIINDYTPSSFARALQLNISSGTNKWNIYAQGTANNYMAGSLGIGTTSLTGISLAVLKTITGATSSFGVLQQGYVQSDVTSSAHGIYNQLNTQAASFTLTNYNHFIANQGIIGANSTITNQYGFNVSSNLTGATNNFGFYGNIASGTGRWNLYMNGTANNYLAGSLGIGATALAGYNLRISKSLTGGTTARSLYIESTVQSDVTTEASYFSSIASVASGSTITDLHHYYAGLNTFNGSTITNHYGFRAVNIINGTNNYAFHSGINAATGRWNLYMGGTAQNYLAGDVGIGVTVNHASAKLQVDSTTEGFLPPRMTATQRGAIASPAEGLVVVQTDGTQGLYIYIGAAWHALTML